MPQELNLRRIGWAVLASLLMHGLIIVAPFSATAGPRPTRGALEVRLSGGGANNTSVEIPFEPAHASASEGKSTPLPAAGPEPEQEATRSDAAMPQPKTDLTETSNLRFASHTLRRTFDPGDYLGSRAVDQTAVPLEEVVIEPGQALGRASDTSPIVLRVYINDAGVVDAVHRISPPVANAAAAAAEQAFLDAKYAPAMKAGRPVLSVKLIQVLNAIAP